MPNSEKDRLAAEVEDRWVDFQDGLGIPGQGERDSGMIPNGIPG